MTDPIKKDDTAYLVAGPLGLVLLAGVLCFGAAICGCGYGKIACTVLDVVHDNCTWIKYLGPDGKETTIQLDKADLVQLAATTAAKKQAADTRDAGK